MEFVISDIDIRPEPWIIQLENHPDVLECHHVAGDDCSIPKVAVSGVDQLQEMLRALRPAGESANTRTTIVLSTIFEKANVLPEAPAEDLRG